MTKKFIPPIHVERTSSPANFFYLSVIQYRKEHHLVIIDNITEDSVSAYALDLATQEGLDLKGLLSVITQWYYQNSSKYPISVEFSKLGMSGKTNKILKNFELDHVSRIIGNDFKYDFYRAPKIRRRRVQQVQTCAADISLKKI